MKKIFFTTAGILSLLMFMACSDDQVSGSPIDDNETTSSSSAPKADTKSSSSIAIDLKEILTLSTSKTDSRSVGLTNIEIYKKENAVKASCPVIPYEPDYSGIIGIAKISQGQLNMAFFGRHLAANIDSLVINLSKACTGGKDDVNIIADSLYIKGNSFNYACVTETEATSIDDVEKAFSKSMDLSCKIVNEAEPQEQPEITLPNKHDPKADPVVVDTTVNTLNRLALQYADPKDLSFDKHVMAYISDSECQTNQDSTSSYPYPDIDNNIYPVDRKHISSCFPKTDSIGHFSKRDKSCKYYVVALPLNEPTGSVLTKVSSDTIMVLQIKYLDLSFDTFTSAKFLIEDCENIINDRTVLSSQSVLSARWSNGGDYNIIYSEWFSESLLKN